MQITFEMMTMLAYVFGFFTVGLLLFVGFRHYKEILSIIFPDMYAEVIMIEADNNIKIWLQKKSADLTFKFNKGIYNLFHNYEIKIPLYDPKNDKKVIGYKVKGGKNVYRGGRVSSFMFVEGKTDPIDPKKEYGNEIDQFPKTREQLLKVDMPKLWTKEESDIMQMLKNLQPFILILLGIGLIAVFIKLGGNT